MGSGRRAMRRGRWGGGNREERDREGEMGSGRLGVA